MPRRRNPDRPPTLEIRLRNKQPVSVADYATSLRAFEDEYRSFVAGEAGRGVSSDLSLFVSRLRSGSLISELVALAPLALPFVENANTILDFAAHLRRGYDYLLAKVKSDSAVSPRTLQNLIDIAEPVAKDGGSIMNVSTIVNGDVHIHLKMVSKDANAAQNVARRIIQPPATALTGVRERVLLYLYQARSDVRSKAGDRAIIESISSSPVRLEFVNGEVKQQIVGGDDNPFRMAYIVDVEIGTVNGRPLLYKVLAVHGSLERPEAA